MILPFEEIYCLCMSENSERIQNISSELKRINVENPIHWWWTCNKSFLNDYFLKFDSVRNKFYDSFLESNPYVYTGVVDCALNHYSIIKTSYNRGINSILIMEDDIQFIDDLKALEIVFDSVPNDYDIIKYYNYMDIKYEQDVSADNVRYVLDKARFKLMSTMMYALSRTGMKLMIDIIETEGLKAADLYFNKLKNICKIYSMNGKILKTQNPYYSEIRHE